MLVAMRFARVVLVGTASVLAGCDATAPTPGSLLGCHQLSTSRLSNGTGSTTAVIRIHPDRVEVVRRTELTPTAGGSATWTLEDDGTLHMSFGDFFIAVNYRFTRARLDTWLGNVIVFADPPQSTREGSAALVRLPCID